MVFLTNNCVGRSQVVILLLIKYFCINSLWRNQSINLLFFYISKDIMLFLSETLNILSTYYTWKTWLSFERSSAQSMWKAVNVNSICLKLFIKCDLVEVFMIPRYISQCHTVRRGFFSPSKFSWEIKKIPGIMLPCWRTFSSLEVLFKTCGLWPLICMKWYIHVIYSILCSSNL